jgi:hypothetical protein
LFEIRMLRNRIAAAGAAFLLAAALLAWPLACCDPEMATPSLAAAMDCCGVEAEDCAPALQSNTAIPAATSVSADPTLSSPALLVLWTPASPSTARFALRMTPSPHGFSPPLHLLHAQLLI